MNAPEKARPAALQINNSGAWKTVVTLDAGDELHVQCALHAVISLCCIGSMHSTTWRIATTATPENLVLYHWSEATGWRKKL